MRVNYRFINTNESLKQCCDEAEKSQFIALDTEFIRNRTYYAKLGLIQLYDGKIVSLIDPLAITDWQPFCHLLINDHILKILHSGGEDLELFWQKFALIPQPIIDTQIMAAFCNYAISCSLTTLVTEKLQVKLDKSETRTDWLRRPLSDKQCNYAAADVFYLLPIAQQLMAESQQNGWYQAALEESQRLATRRTIELSSDLAYQKMSQAHRLNARQLALLQQLAAWRLNYAKSHDIPINHVITIDKLIKIAKSFPTALAQLPPLDLSPADIRRYGRAILSCVEQARKLPETQLPAKIITLQTFAGYKKAIIAFKEALQLVAIHHDINSELLVTRRYLEQLLTWLWIDRSELPILLQGWRNTLTHDALRPLIQAWDSHYRMT